MKDISELDDELSTVTDHPLYSTLKGYVIGIGLDRKWFYLACSKCGRSIGDAAICSTCQCPANQAVKKYALQVEIADRSGSLWVTAF